MQHRSSVLTLGPHLPALLLKQPVFDQHDLGTREKRIGMSHDSAMMSPLPPSLH